MALGERNWQGIERLVNGQIFINEQGKRGKGIMMAVLSSRAATRKYRDAIAARSPITEARPKRKRGGGPEPMDMGRPNLRRSRR